MQVPLAPACHRVCVTGLWDSEDLCSRREPRVLYERQGSAGLWRGSCTVSLDRQNSITGHLAGLHRDWLSAESACRQFVFLHP